MSLSPYPQGSFQEAAFKAALKQPMPSDADFGSREPGFAAAIMLRSGRPEVRFPCLSVKRWFQEAGMETDASKCGAAAVILNDASVALLDLEFLMQLLQEEALPRRKKAGASRALRVALSGISQSAARLSAELKILRSELLYRRILGEECTHLDRLHVGLHDALSFWHDQSLGSGSNNRRVRSNWASREQPGRATWSETWLEQGLNSMSAKASFALLNDTDYLEHLGSRSARLREVFVRRVASAWETAVGARPTVRGGDDGKLSPFQIFYSQACGHTAGLLARDDLPAADQLEFKDRLQALGLLTLPSASTLRRVINGAPNFPRTERGKDRP
jgi:hypothetical protein